MNSVGPETIAVAKGPAGLREAVMERLGEKANMSVLPNQQVSPSPATTDIVSKLIWNCSEDGFSLLEKLRAELDFLASQQA